MDKPDDLTEKASAFWESVTTTFELKVDEFHVLENVCRTMDEIERLENALKNAPVMTKGSRGQEIVHPAFGEVARHRGVLARLLKALDLPYADAAPGRSALSEKRSRAALSRWNRVRAEQAGGI